MTRFATISLSLPQLLVQIATMKKFELGHAYLYKGAMALFLYRCPNRLSLARQ